MLLEQVIHIELPVLLSGVSKGACPLWHTTLLAKCSVLYAAGVRCRGKRRGRRCWASPVCTGRKTRLNDCEWRMSRKRRAGFISRTAAYMKAPVPRPTLRLVDKVSRSCGHIPRKVAGQRATVKAEMNEFTPGLDRRPPSR